MEQFYQYIVQYAIFPIAIICFIIGFVIKHYIKFIPNKYIPLILGCIGLIMNVGLNNWNITLEIILTGIGSGLVATGSFEVVRNIVNKSK